MKSTTVRDCEFHGSYAGLWIHCENKPGLNGFDGVTIKGNIFDACYQFGCYVMGFNALKGGPVDQIINVAVTGNKFYNIRGDPHVLSEAQPLGVTSSTNIFVDHNYFRDNCGFGGLIAGTPVGGSTAFSVSNCRKFCIQYNEITGTRCDRRFDGSAIDADQDSHEGVICNNLTYLNDGPGIQLGSFGGLRTCDIEIHHNQHR